MKQLIIFLFCALTIQCFGQNDKVHYELGEPYHCKHTYKHYSFETTQAIISIKKKTGEKIVIQLFDPINLTLSNQEEYDFGSFGPNFYLENVEKIGDKILFIYYTKKSNNVRLYSKTIDPKTGKFIGQPKLLINFVRKGSAYSLFNIKKSKNEQTLLIYHELQTKEKNDVLSINVFDNDLNIIWSNQVKLPYEDIRSDIQFHSLDDNGFVYFNCYLSNKNSKKKDSKNYVFLIYPPNNELPIVKMINVLDIDVYDIDYEVTKDKLVVGAGFYLEDDIISGIFKLELNSLEDEFQIEKFPFTKNIVNMLGMKPGLPFHFKKTGLVMYSDAKSKLRSSKLQTKGIEVQEDGRIIFIGEQAYIIDSSSGSFKHSDNILFSIISPEGTLELLKIIPKRHFTKDCNECLGYKYFDGPDNYNFFFVDDLKNMQNMTPDKMALCNLDKEGALYLYQINKSSGKENKKLILNKKDFSGHSIKIINTNKIVGFQGKFVIIDVEEGAKNNFLIKIPLD